MGSHRPLRTLLLAALLCAPGLAGAEVYKCKGADGKLSFQNTPCKEGSSGDKMDIRTPAVEGPYKITPEDREWVESTRPQFESVCNKVIAQTNEKFKTQLNGTEMLAACKCSTQRVFSEVPTSQLRGIFERKDRDALFQAIVPSLAFCINLMAKPR